MPKKNTKTRDMTWQDYADVGLEIKSSLEIGNSKQYHNFNISLGGK